MDALILTIIIVCIAGVVLRFVRGVGRLLVGLLTLAALFLVIYIAIDVGVNDFKYASSGEVKRILAQDTGTLAAIGDWFESAWYDIKILMGW